MTPEVEALFRAAAQPSVEPVDPEALWARGRRARRLDAVVVAGIATCAVLVAAVVLNTAAPPDRVLLDTPRATERGSPYAPPPGPVAVTELALPPPGEVRTEVLADGTPVFVTRDLDGVAAVIDARNPHRISGQVWRLVGWCTPIGFQEPVGASRFGFDGGYTYGPAPHGLTPYVIEAVGADRVRVLERGVPAPRPEIPAARFALPVHERAQDEVVGAPSALSVRCPQERPSDLLAGGYVAHDARGWTAVELAGLITLTDGWWRIHAAAVEAADGSVALCDWEPGTLPLSCPVGSPATATPAQPLLADETWAGAVTTGPLLIRIAQDAPAEVIGLPAAEQQRLS